MIDLYIAGLVKLLSCLCLYYLVSDLSSKALPFLCHIMIIMADWALEFCYHSIESLMLARTTDKRERRNVVEEDRHTHARSQTCTNAHRRMDVHRPTDPSPQPNPTPPTTHTHTHARTHARTHAHTHASKRARARIHKHKERETETERQRERETETDGQTETERQRQTETD